MKITQSGSQPSAKGPANWFTGTVRIDPLFQATGPARAAGNAVTFEPGARTAWHTHPLGQTLIVTFGLRLGPAGGRRRSKTSAPGDVVWIRARRETLAWRVGEDGHATHGHRRALDGKAVHWMENMSDEEYQRRPERALMRHDWDYGVMGG